MIRLSVDDVLLLHEQIVELTGGSPGIRHREVVESALIQPFATFDGIDLYPTLVDKAATTGYLLICNHPFIDGNKRIGHAVMEVLLVMNGFELDASIDEQERVILQVAEGKVSREQFAYWVSNCIKPV